MIKPSDAAAFGVGFVVFWICLAVLSFVLSAGCSNTGRSYPETLRIDGSCFVVFHREGSGISAVRYPCPVAREELIDDDGGVL